MIAFMLSLYFSCLLMIAGCTKLANRQPLLRTLNTIKILPDFSVLVIARALPWFEILFALFLASNVAATLASAINIAIFVVFLIVRVVVMRTAPDVDCGCYGSALTKQRHSSIDFLVSIIWLTLTLLLFSLSAIGTTLPQSYTITSFGSVSMLGIALLGRIYFVRHYASDHVEIKPLLPANEGRSK
jgi:hypothetical protein